MAVSINYTNRLKYKVSGVWYLKTDHMSSCFHLHSSIIIKGWHLHFTDNFHNFHKFQHASTIACLPKVGIGIKNPSKWEPSYLICWILVQTSRDLVQLHQMNTLGLSHLCRQFLWKQQKRDNTDNRLPKSLEINLIVDVLSQVTNIHPIWNEEFVLKKPWFKSIL